MRWRGVAWRRVAGSEGEGVTGEGEAAVGEGGGGGPMLALQRALLLATLGEGEPPLDASGGE